MARVSEKALRPRQYVFNRLSAERIAALAPGVRKLREQEKRQALSARAARRAADRHIAARHAENIMAGVTRPVPETDQIGELEKELEELRQKKRQLFEQLRKCLEEDNSNARDKPSASNKEATPSVKPEVTLQASNIQNDVERSKEKPRRESKDGSSKGPQQTP